MFESYLRVANEKADDESSDHDSDMGTKGTGDRESEESGSEAARSEDDELVEEGDARTEPWWIEQEDQEHEERDDLESADKDDESSDLAKDQAIPAAQHAG